MNFSTRAAVGATSGQLVAGFAISGETARTIVIRAVGPGLARFGLSGTLSDPVIQLFRGNAEIGANRNWGTAKSAGVQSWSNTGYRLEEMFRTVGAFPLDAQQPDAALWAALAPGLYTVRVSSAGGASGTVLLEVYELP